MYIALAVLGLALLALVGVFLGWVVPVALLIGIITAAAAGAAATYVTQPDRIRHPGDLHAEGAGLVEEHIDAAIKGLSDSDALVRLAAVRKLESIGRSRDDPELVADLLLGHLRQRSLITTAGSERASIDVQTALDALLDLHPERERRAREAGRERDSGDRRGVNLSGLCLRGVTLVGRDLENANLASTDLTVADLRDAKLHGAVLSDAQLAGAILDKADLRGAHYDPAALTLIRGAPAIDAPRSTE